MIPLHYLYSWMFLLLLPALSPPRRGSARISRPLHPAFILLDVINYLLSHFFHLVHLDRLSSLRSGL